MGNDTRASLRSQPGGVVDAGHEGSTPCDTALSLCGPGYHSHAIHPNPPEWRPGEKSQKRPIGLDWGKRWTEEKIRSTFRRYPTAGVGIALGPGRAPGGGWLIDLEIDGPEGAASLATLLGGEEIDTPTWSSRRGRHSLFSADGDGLQSLLNRAGASEGSGPEGKGAWHLPELPGLELRIGGYKPDGAVKAVQSVVPPTIGDDGNPREWLVPPTVELAPLPASAYAVLDAIAERKAIQVAPVAQPPTPATANGFPRIATTDSPSIFDRAAAYLTKCDPAISGQRGHDKAFKAACKVGPGFDLPPEIALRLLREVFNPRCQPPWSEAELVHKVEDSYKVETRRGWLRDAPPKNGRPKRTSAPTIAIGTNGDTNGAAPSPSGEEAVLILGRSGMPLSCASNARIWLDLMKPPGFAKYDTFRRAVLLDGEALTDQHVIDLTMEVEQSLQVPWCGDHIRAAVLHNAHRNQYSSLVEYLDGLRWDGIPRIEEFFPDHFDCPRNAYHAEVGRILFLSAAARAYRPGVKVDTVVVLIGKQGVGKSLGIAALCPQSEWFTDDIGNDLFAGKAGEGLQGKWLVELAELARVNRSTIEVVKSFISRQVDRYRPPYGRTAQDFPRTCVFVGTTNSHEPFQDSENRRYLPIRVGDADPAAIRAIRDQLWAEAVARFKAGEEWWISSSQLVEQAKEQTELGRAVDAWESLLADRLAHQDRTTVAEAARMLGITPDRLGKSEQIRVGNALRTLGFERKRDPMPPRAWYYERTSVPT